MGTRDTSGIERTWVRPKTGAQQLRRIAKVIRSAKVLKKLRRVVKKCHFTSIPLTCMNKCNFSTFPLLLASTWKSEKYKSLCRGNYV